MEKENKFESRYGISKKNLKKMFRNLAVDTAGSVEKEHAMDIYKEDAGEMMFGYIDEWNLMEDCDERACSSGKCA